MAFLISHARRVRPESRGRTVVSRHPRRDRAVPRRDWAPLKGKNVKILSIEKVDDSSKDAGLIMRLEFAKAQLEKNYDEVAEKSGTLAGIVLIFDSADGGMIAATLPQCRNGNRAICLILRSGISAFSIPRN